MRELVCLLAQDMARMNESLQTMRWGITGVGVGALIAAVGCFCAKPGSSQAMQTLHYVIGVGLAILSCALFLYAWMGIDVDLDFS